jgi:hypothetical protein
MNDDGVVFFQRQNGRFVVEHDAFLDVTSVLEERLAAENESGGFNPMCTVPNQNGFNVTSGYPGNHTVQIW